MTGIAPVPVSSRVARGRRATGADVSRRSCNDAGGNRHLVLARARRMVRGSDALCFGRCVCLQSVHFFENAATIGGFHASAPRHCQRLQDDQKKWRLRPPAIDLGMPTQGALPCVLMRLLRVPRSGSGLLCFGAEAARAKAYSHRCLCVVQCGQFRMDEKWRLCAYSNGLAGGRGEPHLQYEDNKS